MRVHFSKFYQSKCNRTKWFPSRESIALTLKEWTDLKALSSEVDEVVKCSQIMLDTDHEGAVEVLRVPFQRQFGVDEEEDQSNLQLANEEVLNEIVRLSEETQQKKLNSLPQGF